ncbi:MAG: CHAT domain-containing protein [Pseudomonadota bacterium]|nr:CHAT domain-containing protein [Pseudomonadota bacterium]
MHALDPSVERAEHLQRQADVLLAEGDHAQAEQRYREASDMLLVVYGPSHSRYAEGVKNLALAYVAMGRYKEATTLHQQVIDISRATAGEDAPLYLMSLSNLATVHRAMGSFSEAEKLYQQALESYKRLHDPAAIASILTDLAWVYAITGRVREALAAMSDSETARDQMISRVVSRGSERDQTACVESIRQGYYLFLSIVLRYFPGSPDAPGVLLEIIFRRKALGLELSLARRVALMSERKLSIQPRLEAYRLLRQQIARKALRCSSANESPNRQYRDLQNRQTERREEEAALSREISDVNPFAETLGVISLHAVASALASSSALVEFVKFRRYDVASMQIHENNRWQEYRYAALVLLAGAPQAVRIIDLGDAGTIDRLINQFRSCIIGRADVQYRGLVSDEEPSTVPLESPGLALRAALFDPIRRIIGDISHVILATDGELTRLPFEALPLDSGTRYLGDDYCLSYLDSGRELLRSRTGSSTLASSPVVIADPDFDLSKGDGYHRSRSLLQALLRKWRGRGGPENERPDAGDKASDRQTPNTRYKQWYFERLPGTRIEGEIIASMLSVPLWHGPRASDKNLKERRSPRILHLATHGFFLKKHRSHSDPALPFSESEPWLFPLENPLLHSGIALAGANHVFTREVLPEDGNDGVLTAEEVAGLDLLGTELVVLSACETGLGEVAIGEGVLGLRRAFILAGTKTLIMSLWKVADLPTVIFMSRLYENLIDARMHRDAALRQAMLPSATHHRPAPRLVV